MSQHSPANAGEETLRVESGLKALQSSPTFRGPVEPHEGHESNDHIALIYEDRDEQFAAAIPFLLEGLARGERCMHVTDDSSREEILAAMREVDSEVDVDAALDSGALTFHTKQDTYCRDGAFDPDEMIRFLSDAIDGATAEYEGLRIGSEATWILGDDVPIPDFMAYEERVNELFDGTDCIALCQYNRERFPAEVIRDVIRTHPHLVYDQTVSHNYYYTPPEEFFGPDRPDHEVERMLKSLRDQTTATVSLRKRERQLKRENDRLESFASMLAHELRNPLAIAQIYHQQAARGDPEASGEVEKALDRIEEMIDVLLVTARSTDSAVDSESVELAEVAADAWADLSPDHADLVTETDRVVRADPIHLQHLLKNLLKNAVEHGSTSPRSRSHEDAVEHGSTSNRPTADDAIEHADESVTVRIGNLSGTSTSAPGFYVEDDGPGIPEDEREEIFEAGYTTESEGIGLGLTFVSQLAEMYDWDCTVTESEDGGARFEFAGVGDVSSGAD